MPACLLLRRRRRRWQAGNSSTFPRLAMGGDSSGGQLTLETLAALASPRHATPGSIKLMAAAWAFAPQVSAAFTFNQRHTQPAASCLPKLLLPGLRFPAQCHQALPPLPLLCACCRIDFFSPARHADGAGPAYGPHPCHQPVQHQCRARSDCGRSFPKWPLFFRLLDGEYSGTHLLGLLAWHARCWRQ